MTVLSANRKAPPGSRFSLDGFDVSATLFMGVALIFPPYLSVKLTVFFLVLFVVIHTVQASGYFYFKKNTNLDHFVFRKIVTLSKVAYLSLYIILERPF